MRITIGQQNNATASINAGTLTLTIGNLPGFDLDIQNLSYIYNTTRSQVLPFQNNAIAEVVVNQGLQTTNFVFNSMPAGFQTGDTMVVVLELPIEYANYFAAPAPLDPSAAAYLAAANIVPGQIYPGNGTTDYPFKSERIIAAVNNLFLALKSANLYSRFVVFYPFLGFTNADNFINAINPGTNNLIAVGSFTAPFTRLGLAFDGASIVSTVPISVFAQDSLTAGYYYETIAGGFDYGSYNTAITGLFAADVQGNYVYPRSFSTSPTTIGSTSYGLTLFTFTAPNTGAVYNRGALNASVSGTDSTPNSGYGFPVYLGSLSGSPSGFSLTTCGMFFFMNGINGTDAATLTTIIENFAFGVGRNQGGVIYNAFQFFGDSITAGELASPIYHAWITNVSYNEAATQVSWAVPGTTIGDCNSTAILNLVSKGNGYTKVFLAFNTNDVIDDIMSSGTTYNLSVFTTNYVAVLGKFLAAGYLPSDICTVLGYYNNLGAQYDSYNAYIEAYPGGAEALQDAYISAAATASANAGITNAFNLKPVMIAAGGNALLSGIHPNNAGHDVIGNYLSANLVGF